MKKKENQKNREEEFKINGSEIIAKVQELIHQGNIHQIIIKNEEGKIFIEIPLILGLVGAALTPILVAVGAVGALVANLTIVVEKNEE